MIERGVSRGFAFAAESAALRQALHRDAKKIRAYKARPKPAQPESTVADGLADRILDMEHVHREQIAELEERVDFAERLLTKQREQIGPG